MHWLVSKYHDPSRNDPTRDGGRTKEYGWTLPRAGRYGQMDCAQQMGGSGRKAAAGRVA
jgi:hypothetical protein